jgi:hypothetical protein
VALLVNNAHLFSKVQLNTPLQAVAARVTLNKVITFCSIYLPPSDYVSKVDITNLIEQLPSPFVLLGDFNGHSPLWGNHAYNSRGQMLEDVFSEMNLCILNNGSATYIHPASGSTSTLDLSICAPSLVLDYEWKIHDDLCGSDHFPVILTNPTHVEDTAPSRWNFKKADWLTFRALCLSRLTEEAVMSAEDPTSEFTALLMETAAETIPKTLISSKTLPKVPWFDQNCKKAIKERKKAQRKVFSEPTSANIQNFKMLRAKARYVVKQQKKNSWRNFCSTLNSKTQTQKVWKAIRKIKGKRGSSSVGHLKVNDTFITEKKQVADLIAANISTNSSTSNYSSDFQKVNQNQNQNQNLYCLCKDIEICHSTVYE